MKDNVVRLTQYTFEPLREESKMEFDTIKTVELTIDEQVENFVRSTDRVLAIVSRLKEKDGQFLNEVLRPIISEVTKEISRLEERGYTKEMAFAVYKHAYERTINVGRSVEATSKKYAEE